MSEYLLNLSVSECCLIFFFFILEHEKVQVTNNTSCFPSRLWPSSFGVLSFRQETDGAITGDMNLDLCLCIMCSHGPWACIFTYWTAQC